ncbi:hypothetical protein KUTeg_012961, partial [Tegillarca granosa]
MELIQDIYNLDIKVFNYIAYFMLCWGFCNVFILRFLDAPYGRYSRQGFGLFVNAKVAWVIQELPAFAVPVMLILFFDFPQMSKTPNRIMLACFLIHYFQRTFIFSFLIRGGKPTPLLPFVLAIMFCCGNGYLQGGYLIKYADFGPDWSSNPRFYIGLILFFCGMFINIQSDHILRNLRKPGETGYKIPTGGMFDYVSGANFFGESVEWWGFGIACGTLPALAFAIFTTLTIGPRACSHH